MVDVNRLVGFCLLIRREVIEAIGLLDEQFGVGCFEDDDYCLRAIQAGYRAVIAGDAFVHHFGGRTFVGSGVDSRRAHAREPAAVPGEVVGNRQAEPAPPPGLDEPTRDPARAAGRGPFAVDMAPGGGLRLRLDLRAAAALALHDRPRLGPDARRPAWRASGPGSTRWSSSTPARSTRRRGSSSRSAAGCSTSPGATISRPPATSRCGMPRGEWLFWMDSDDTIPPECGRELRDLVERQADPQGAGLSSCRCTARVAARTATPSRT